MHTTKWQQMLSVVNQHPNLSQFNPTSQFKHMALQRMFAENILVFFLQYIGLMFTTLTPQPMPIWFASGTACGFIFLRGYSVLPGIWLGSLLAYHLASHQSILALTSASLLTLQACLLLWLNYRYISPTLLFPARSTLGKFIFASGLVTALSSYLLAQFCHSPHWLTWWLANWNGILVLGCALVMLDSYFPQIDYLKKLDRRKLITSYTSIFAFVIGFIITSSRWLPFATVPIIIWLRKYYGQCGAMAGVFLFSFCISLAINLGSQVHLQTLSIIQVIIAVEAIL